MGRGCDLITRLERMKFQIYDVRIRTFYEVSTHDVPKHTPKQPTNLVSRHHDSPS